MELNPWGSIRKMSILSVKRVLKIEAQGLFLKSQYLLNKLCCHTMFYANAKLTAFFLRLF
jgi:hypothetical protein